MIRNKERQGEASHHPLHAARVTKGPGIAVRAQPGTKYRVYGLAVMSSETPASYATSTETRTVYVSLQDAEEPILSGATLSPTAADDVAAAAAAAVDGIRTVREYDRMVQSVLMLPLGDSLEERSTVRGYTWNGTVPAHLRPFLWRLLCGHMPCAPASLSRQQAELRRKRYEYDNFVSKYYKISITDFLQPSTLHSGFSRFSEEGQQPLIPNRSSMNTAPTSSTALAAEEARKKKMMMMMIAPDEQAILSQIALDLPRHTYALFHHAETASALARCLFLWSRRHPAVGYVQGIDDIMVVFFFVFLSGAIYQRNIQLRRSGRENNNNNDSAADESTRRGNYTRASANETTINTGIENRWISASVVFTRDVSELDAALRHLPEELFRAAEADTYFCGGFFLSWLQDNFVQGQSGILRSMVIVEKVLEKSDPAVLATITSHGMTLLDCCFQWVHCLLARELPLEIIVLLWEKYLAMGNSETVMDFHAYVCAALLMQLRDKLLGKPVDVVIQLLKDPLGARVKHEEKQGAGENDAVYDRHWLEELLTMASLLLGRFPVSSLTGR